MTAHLLILRRSPVALGPARRRPRWFARTLPSAVLTALALVAALLALPATAAAQPAAAHPTAVITVNGERIASYRVQMVLARDGSMRVTETIEYDFGPGYAGRRGIFRTIPQRVPYPSRDGGPPLERVYPIEDVRVSSPTGAPTAVDRSGGEIVTLRIGEENTYLSAQRQTYVISYLQRGVVNSFDDHQELYWNAVGAGWDVPVTRAEATVEGPAAVTEVRCLAGAVGGTDTCPASVLRGGQARFTARGLGPQQAFTLVASFPPGTFPGAEPIVQEKQTLARGFRLDPATGAAAVGVLGLLGAGVVMTAARRGRDERYLAVTPGLQPGIGQDTATARVPLFGRGPVAVQFTPPDGMRPGQLGTLLDERANVVDVTATIIDLAVRGYLHIEEVERAGFLRKADWRLTRRQRSSEELHAYEQTLYDAVFDGRDEVLLSDLRQTFLADLQKVQRQLYDDVTANGWFRGDPAWVRLRWQILGVVVILAGGALTAVLASTTTFGLVGVAVVACGVLALVTAPMMPARTARGTALLAHAKGFRTYLETAEANQIRFEEGVDVFSRYLPFAIVFGVAERWASVFAQLAASGAAVAAPTWYVGSGWGPGGWNYAAFGSSMDDFATTTSGAIAAPTPSSSGSSGFGGGGFSGGGGGGGGGGSW